MPVAPPTYRPKGARTKRDVSQDHDHRRGTPHERGYTYRLRQAMNRWKLAHPLCLGCQAVGDVTPTAVTDHVVPAEGNQALLWDQGNWQPACRPHHDIVKRRLDDLFKAGRIKAPELRLDSTTAVALTKELLG
jgi:5-methylcytosine-specific restriction protein A